VNAPHNKALELTGRRRSVRSVYSGRRAGNGVWWTADPVSGGRPRNRGGSRGGRQLNADPLASGKVPTVDRLLHYEEGVSRTVLNARPLPGHAEWFSFIERAFENLATELGIEFPTSDTHNGGVFPLGIRARYQEREFSLWCDEPGQLIVVHDNLRAQRIHNICSVLARTWSGEAVEPAG
jgi:hypothetical protein